MHRLRSFLFEGRAFTGFLFNLIIRRVRGLQGAKGRIQTHSGAQDVAEMLQSYRAVQARLMTRA